MNRLLLTFYGDDFTGSTDALEQLTLAGIHAVLFMEPPTRRQLAKFKGLKAIGVAGLTRSMKSQAMEQALTPAFKKLKALGAPHVHYKVCSTFDSSRGIGSIGRVMEVAARIFPAPFIPLLVAAPMLGRYTVFGQHFARYGIGSAGAIHRLDRHPSISRHPVTPMTEADLRLHLSRQTRMKVALFDVLQLALPLRQARAALKHLLKQSPDAVLFDAVYQEQMHLIGSLIDHYADRKQPLFSVGSSGIEMALGAHWGRSTGLSPVSPVEKPESRPAARMSASSPLLVGSGSCSPVTSGQIEWALKHGFTEIPLDTAKLAATKSAPTEIQRAAVAAAKHLNAGKSVIVHTTKSGSDKRLSAKLKSRTAEILGSALGKVLRGAMEQRSIQRICIAGGDTSSYAAGALGIEALEMIAPLTPGAPLCRVHALDSPADQIEIVFKGGQVGAPDCFDQLKRGLH